MNKESRTAGVTLRNTFVHIPGVGYSTERHLWEKGVQTWDDFREEQGTLDLRSDVLAAISGGLDISEDSLKRLDHVYFANALPSREYWRAYPDFKHETAFLDIETTGLSPEDSVVTVIGLFDGHKMSSFVRGDNISEFPSEMRRYKQIVTYNGARFDLPFLQQAFKGIRFEQIHIDLRYPLRRLGFAGGLKAIERRLGIGRSGETRDLTGLDAVRLWHAYEQGDDHALDILLEYNAEDVRNLEALMDLSYCSLKNVYLRYGFASGDEWRADLKVSIP